MRLSKGGRKPASDDSDEERQEEDEREERVGAGCRNGSRSISVMVGGGSRCAGGVSVIGGRIVYREMGV